MESDKLEFINKIAGRVQNISNEEFKQALNKKVFEGKIPSVISIPKKRDPEEDIQELE